MTLDEAMDDNTVSRSEALSEVAKHSLLADAFLDELGDWPEYSSKAVMEWLGY